MSDYTFETQVEATRLSMANHFAALWEMDKTELAAETARLDRELESIVSHGGGSHGLAPNTCSGHGL